MRINWGLVGALAVLTAFWVAVAWVIAGVLGALAQ
jgi:hypothetical protein